MRCRAFRTLCLAALASSAGSCESNSCERGLHQIELQIEAMCQETAFRGIDFCTVCVPAGYYSVDDSCTCRVLNFDADFCFYTPAVQSDPVDAAAPAAADSGSPIVPPEMPTEAGVNPAGAPDLRAALEYAASACADRRAQFPRERAGAQAAAEDAGTE